MTAVWDDLVSGALLGTERRPFAPPELSGGLGEVVGAAGDLAGAATAVWAYQEVGRRPRPGPPPGDAVADRAAGHPSPAVAVADRAAGHPSPAGDFPAAAPADDRPLLPAGTLRSLAPIVAEPHLRPLLGDWLSLAAADGRRLPPEWLPVLLDLTADRDRPHLEAAGGPRAAWLAHQRADWAAGGAGPAAGALARAVLAGGRPEWDGRDEDRLAAFSLVRAADPAAARDLAGRVWSEEPPATRAAMVARFLDGLSAEDEPFLEEALDDRRKEVRLAAASLLARLPSSRFAARMAARAQAGVRLRARGRLQIDPPAELDPPARRDGMTATAAHPEQWMLQVVGAAPLDAWPAPDALVAAAVRAGADADAGALVAAWSLAVERQSDAAWARRLISAGATPTAGVVGALPAGEAERSLLDWLHRVPLTDAAGVLAGLPGPWTAAVTDAVMAALGHLVSSGSPGGPAAVVRDALPRFALAADPSRAGAAAAAAGALEALPDDRRPAARLFWGRALTSLNALVHFRQAMHQEFLDR